MLEKFLTLPESDFRRLMRSEPEPPVNDGKREAYRYAKVIFALFIPAALRLRISIGWVLCYALTIGLLRPTRTWHRSVRH